FFRIGGSGTSDVIKIVAGKIRLPDSLVRSLRSYDEKTKTETEVDEFVHVLSRNSDGTFDVLFKVHQNRNRAWTSSMRVGTANLSTGRFDLRHDSPLFSNELKGYLSEGAGQVASDFHQNVVIVGRNQKKGSISFGQHVRGFIVDHQNLPNNILVLDMNGRVKKEIDVNVVGNDFVDVSLSEGKVYILSNLYGHMG
ncbi:MAG: hypothetical protein V4760_04450, partial [Bdellovibrionota bacterium]